MYRPSTRRGSSETWSRLLKKEKKDKRTFRMIVKKSKEKIYPGPWFRLDWRWSETGIGGFEKAKVFDRLPWQHMSLAGEAE